VIVIADIKHAALHAPKLDLRLIRFKDVFLFSRTGGKRQYNNQNK
jgi:hypothetical protein